uniref:Uncharacterized protein n=1 Tax=Tetranychus urticae TaxID=32264 RepID=T1KID2_TETUR
MNPKYYPRIKIKTGSDRVWRRPEQTQDLPHYLICIGKYSIFIFSFMINLILISFFKSLGSKTNMEKLKKKPELSQDLKEKFYTCKDITKYFTSAASSEKPAVARKGRPTKRKRAASKEPQRKETTEDEATSSTNQTSQNQSDAEEQASESSDQEDSSADYAGATLPFTDLEYAWMTPLEIPTNLHCGVCYGNML